MEKNYILNEQGYFWWRDEKYPDTQFAPEKHVTGWLKIAEDGGSGLSSMVFSPRISILLNRLLRIARPGSHLAQFKALQRRLERR
ncbi:hypothetical protein [Paraburkholderia sp. BCC1885]|uniref:hypothetical protein n=1 Tax=Paraburkholderia sp. BCC1885 TaxID=2562669 RepID=UPI001181CF9C|nr:hypothetical protein [Paraburkholderia sp. BCC1885]